MAVKGQTPTDDPFDNHAGDHDGPTDTALNLAQRLAEREEVRRLTWMSYSESIKVATEDVEATLDALDLDRVDVEVTGKSILDTDLRVRW